MDSNHDKELQRLLCYHYTTGQTRPKIAFRQGRRNEENGEKGKARGERREPSAAKPQPW